MTTMETPTRQRNDRPAYKLTLIGVGKFLGWLTLGIVLHMVIRLLLPGAFADGDVGEFNAYVVTGFYVILTWNWHLGGKEIAAAWRKAKRG
jgi:hypothetical protein